jgi:hypothetical protein
MNKLIGGYLYAPRESKIDIVIETSTIIVKEGSYPIYKPRKSLNSIRDII